MAPDIDWKPWSSEARDHQDVGSPEEDHEDEEGWSTSSTETTLYGVVQPGEKASGRPYSNLPVPNRAFKKVREGLFNRGV